MQPGELYHEEIGSFWGRLAVGLFFSIGVLFLVLLIYQPIYGPIGDKPAPDWYFLLMAGLMLLVGYVVRNFATLTISATPRGLTAGYGRFRFEAAWADVAGAQLFNRSAFLTFAGYGIRWGRLNGKTVLAYNTMGASLILLELRQGRYKYFAFSTKKPDEVMALIKYQIPGYKIQ
jgi:hypothetical protein